MTAQTFLDWWDSKYGTKVRGYMAAQEAWRVARVKGHEAGRLQGLEEAAVIAGKVAHEITGNSNLAHMKRYAIASVVEAIREKLSGEGHGK